MKKLVFATAISVALIGTALAEEVKVGLVFGYTGPIESITPGMAQSAETAFKEINDSGKWLNGKKLTAIRADSTCTDSTTATSAAERLVTSDKVVALMSDCSGVTTAILNNVSMPNGIPLISPSATSPALSTMEDGGLFFRTSPSDARAGQVLSEILHDKGYKSVAVTYTNNDYGKGYADALAMAFKKLGGNITINAAHEDGKGDYSADIGALAAAGGDVLVVLGYGDQGGLGIIRAAVDLGAFSKFALGDGMYNDTMLQEVGAHISGSFGIHPASEGKGYDAFVSLANAAGFEPEKSYRAQSYDAGALVALAMAKGGSADGATIAANLLKVSNTPGTPILPGELGKALDIIKSGGEIDYVGATNVELIGPGEAAGTYQEYVIEKKAFRSVGMR